MTGTQAAYLVYKSRTIHLVRPRKDAPGEYDAKPYFTGNKRGWFALDSFSASAVVKVHQALNEENRAKFSGLSLPRMVQVALKFV